MSNRELSLVLTQDGLVNVNCSGPNNSRVNKIVSIETLASAISSEEDITDLPMFPMGLRKFYKYGQRVVVAIEYPETIIQEFSYHNEKYKIPAPRSLWFHSLTESRTKPGEYQINRSHIYSLQLPLMNMNASLYKWPFPNHDVGFGGGICWGNDKNYGQISKGCSLNNLTSLYSLYFSTNFNDDLGWKMSGERSGSAIRTLQNKEIFETSWLRSAGVTALEAIDIVRGERRR